MVYRDDLRYNNNNIIIELSSPLGVIVSMDYGVVIILCELL